MHNLTVKKQAQGLEIALKSAKTSCLIKDTLYQIIRATHPSIPNPLEQFSYDETGNRLTDNTHNNYQYNELNQLTEDDSCIYAYDADGNMTEKIDKTTGDTTHFVYDIENKLVEVRKPGMLAKYTYDALGRRMSKEVNGEVKQFRYDEEDLILEMDANNSVTANYTFGPGIDNPLKMNRNGNNYYYVKDGLGSVTALTDSTGNVKHEYKYGVFGKVVEESGDTIENPFTYTSRELDKETGNYYYRARYYDPEIGIFISEDPIQLAAGDVNYYRYLWNNPLNWKDPFGFEGENSDPGAIRKKINEGVLKTDPGLAQNKPLFNEVTQALADQVTAGDKAKMGLCYANPFCNKDKKEKQLAEDLVERVKKNNPELWEKYQKDKESREKKKPDTCSFDSSKVK
jgi:RHS repeat-associated protein